MKNKDFLLKALNQLLWVWSQANILIKNIEANNYDENTINFLAKKLKESINETTDKERKEKMKKWLNLITEIWKLEKEDKKENEEQLKKIENILDWL